MKKYIILTLVVITIITISCLPTFAFFSNQNNVSGTIKLGELDFFITNENLNLSSIMPLDTISPKISIINSKSLNVNDSTNLIPFYMRFSLNLLSNEREIQNFRLNLAKSEDFVVINDTYYHLAPIYPSQIVEVVESITLPETIDNSFQGQPLSIEMLVEAIQTQKEAVSTFWPEFYEIIFKE